MKYISLCALFLTLCSFAHAEQITMDLSTATDLNGNPINYSQTYGEGYYDLTDVWDQTYNDADSCRHILVNDGVFRLSHLPSEMSYGGSSWEGFTLSTVSQDTACVFGCVANGGLAGVRTPYVIGYYSEWVSTLQGYSSNIIDFNGEYYPEYVYICQNSNTHKAIKQGEFNARPFTEQDTLALIIQTLDSTKNPTATTIYYLAIDGTCNEGWVKVPLTALDQTSCLSFSMTTTDIGDWGANTPLYFALDGLTINTEIPTALPQTPILNKPCAKVIQDGQLLIFHNGQWYTTTGQLLE